MLKSRERDRKVSAPELRTEVNQAGDRKDLLSASSTQCAELRLVSKALQAILTHPLKPRHRRMRAYIVLQHIS